MTSFIIFFYLQLINVKYKLIQLQLFDVEFLFSEEHIFRKVLAKYYTLRLKWKPWFVGNFVNMEAFFTVVIIIVIIIIFAPQRQFLDDSLRIAENHALTKLSSLKAVVIIFFLKRRFWKFFRTPKKRQKQPSVSVLYKRCY